MGEMNFVKSLRLAMNFLTKRTKYSIVHMVILVCLIGMRGFITNYDNQFTMILQRRDSTSVGQGVQKPSITYGEMIVFMQLKLWWWANDFMFRMMFDVLITPIGGIIAKHILENMIGSEDPKVMEVVPSYCEYVITESSKAIAKLVRIVFVNLASSMVDVSSNFWSIYKDDKSTIRWISLSFAALVIIAAILKIIHLKEALYADSAASDATSEKEKQYVETIEQLPTVKTSKDENKMIVRYKRTLNKWEDLSVKAKVLTLSNDFVYNVFTDLVALVIVMLYITDMAKNQSENDKLPEKVGVIMDRKKTFSYITSIVLTAVRFYKDLGESVVQGQKLFKYLEYKKTSLSDKIRVNTFSDSIEVKSLTYVCKDKVIFNDASFTLRKGDKAVVIGRNGMGKSSLFKVILGFDDYKGTVLFDGIDMHRLCMRDFRGLVAYVPQDTKLFDESIYYNLTFANNKPFEEVIEMCQKMKIHDAIMGLPAGYNTMVGESGKCINGGLKQKIFYTRAMLQDAEIYMFDEPTNNLDAQHSRFLEELIVDKEYESKTFLVICHDKEIAEKFPKKLKLEDGRIWEIDTV